MHDDNDEEFDLEIDWGVSPLHLWLMHVLSDRKWDIEGTLRVPTPEEIETRVHLLVAAVREFGGGAYYTLNGLKVYKDPEFPDSYEIYVSVGHVSPRIPEGSK